MKLSKGGQILKLEKRSIKVIIKDVIKSSLCDEKFKFCIFLGAGGACGGEVGLVAADAARVLVRQHVP